jgi:hypothetical protein
VSAADEVAQVDAVAARIASRFCAGDWRGAWRAVRVLRRLAPGCSAAVVHEVRVLLELELTWARRRRESRAFHPDGGAAA